MPQALITLITPFVANGLFALTGSTAIVMAATGFKPSVTTSPIAVKDWIATCTRQ